MALHLAENGCYGIKIHPKRIGEEINSESLHVTLAKFGIVKELQLPNSNLAFAYYEQYEEARACLENLKCSKDYSAWPGWPKQTTADEKYKNGTKSTLRENVKGNVYAKSNQEVIKEKHKNNQEEDSNGEETNKKSSSLEERRKTTPKRSGDKVPFRSSVGSNNDDSRKKENVEADKLRKNEIKRDYHSENKKRNQTLYKRKYSPLYKNKNFDFSKKLSGVTKDISSLSINSDDYNKKNQHPTRKFNRSIVWSKFTRKSRSKSECKGEKYNKNATIKIRRNHNRNLDKSKFNLDEKVNIRFGNKIEIKPDEKDSNKSTKNSLQKLKDEHCKTLTTCKNSKKDDAENKTQMQNWHYLIPVMDAWIADSIKHNRCVKKASYIAILNLPLDITEGMVYDLCTLFVPVLSVDVRYDKRHYLPPHAYVFTHSKKDSMTLKVVIEKRGLREKILHVVTEEELEGH